MFIFGTLVKVIAGFYIGCTGYVTDYADYRNLHGDIRYEVELTCYKPSKIKVGKVRFHEDEIKKIRTELKCENCPKTTELNKFEKDVDKE